MTKREKKLELLSAYLDGEATERERQVVEILLQTDQEAQTIMADFRGMRQELAMLPVDTPTLDLGAAVCDTLEREALFNGVPNEPRIANWQIYGAAATFVLTVTMGWWLFPTLMRPQQRPVEDRLANQNNLQNNSVFDQTQSPSDGSAASSTVPRAATSGSAESGTTPEIEQPYDVMVGLISSKNGASRASRLTRIQPNTGSVEQKLADGRLRPGELLTIAPDSFTNQIVVDLTYASNRWMLEDALETELYRCNAARISRRSTGRRLACDERFFAHGQTSETKGASDSENASSFAINVSFDDAVALLNGLTEVAIETGIESDIRVNGLKLDQQQDARSALADFVIFRKSNSTQLAKRPATSAPHRISGATTSVSNASADRTGPQSQRLDDRNERLKMAESGQSKVPGLPMRNSDENNRQCEYIFFCITLRSPSESQNNGDAESAPIPSTQPANMPGS